MNDAASALAADLDALLPQTQCTRCGYNGCQPYAAAMANNEAELNQCPPGGATTIAALAQRLKRPALPLNPVHGFESDAMVAVIDEARCIGCAKCLPPCPVDAIIGASRQMHTVLYADCTGCELCIAPCPVDCISLQPRASLPPAFIVAAPTPAQNLARYTARNARLLRDDSERQALLNVRKAAATATAIAAEASAAPMPPDAPTP